MLALPRARERPASIRWANSDLAMWLHSLTVLHLEANTAAQNIHALPPGAQINATLARPVDSVDSRGERIATTVSVMCLSHYKRQGNYVVMKPGDALCSMGLRTLVGHVDLRLRLAPTWEQSYL
jgi:hypothetical protein